MLRNVAGQWLIIGLLTLLGLVLLYQWFTGPLSLLVEMIGSKCGPDRYYSLARQWRGKFAQLRQDVTLLDQTDQATDLPNSERFVGEVRRLENRPGCPWSAFVVDLDYFSRINDTLGHSGVDRLLREVGNAIARWCRRSNLVARLDGARFGILCEGLSLSQATAVAERLLKAVGNIAIPATGTDGSIQYLSASIGVAMSPEDGVRASRVLVAAANRVDVAKQSGRNCVVANSHSRPRRAG